MSTTIGWLAVLFGFIASYIVARIQFPVDMVLSPFLNDEYYDANSAYRELFTVIYCLIIIFVLSVIKVILDPQAFLYYVVNG